MVWVNPPNRVNYTVIRHLRNVRRYASPKCSTTNVIVLLRKVMLTVIALATEESAASGQNRLNSCDWRSAPLHSVSSAGAL